MDEILKIFSNRELALIIWLITLIILMSMSNGIRKSMINVIGAFFKRRIVVVLSFLIIYVTLIIILLSNLSLWDKSLFKDTTFWFFSFVIITFFGINKAKDIGFFKSILIDCFKWTIFIEFLVNFYNFSLTIELLLFPFILFISVTQAFSQTDQKNEKVSKFLTNFLATIGAIYLFYALYKTIFDYANVFTLNNLNALILPIALTILVLPFFYLLALYIQYELIFVQADFVTNDKEKSHKLKKYILLTANLNLNKLQRIKKNLNKFDVYHSLDIKEYIDGIIKK